jgi:hypothetical protein
MNGWFFGTQGKQLTISRNEIAGDHLCGVKCALTYASRFIGMTDAIPPNNNPQQSNQHKG